MNASQEQMIELALLKSSLLLAANHWVQKRVLTDLPADKEENALLYASRAFSDLCVTINPALWGPTPND